MLMEFANPGFVPDALVTNNLVNHRDEGEGSRRGGRRGGRGGGEGGEREATETDIAAARQRKLRRKERRKRKEERRKRKGMEEDDEEGGEDVMAMEEDEDEEEEIGRGGGDGGGGGRPRRPSGKRVTWREEKRLTTGAIFGVNEINVNLIEEEDKEESGGGGGGVESRKKEDGRERADQRETKMVGKKGGLFPGDFPSGFEGIVNQGFQLTSGDITEPGDSFPSPPSHCGLEQTRIET